MTDAPLLRKAFEMAGLTAEAATEARGREWRTKVEPEFEVGASPERVSETIRSLNSRSILPADGSRTARRAWSPNP